jgi:hypothetical protein
MPRLEPEALTVGGIEQFAIQLVQSCLDENSQLLHLLLCQVGGQREIGRRGIGQHGIIAAAAAVLVRKGPHVGSTLATCGQRGARAKMTTRGHRTHIESRHVWAMCG